MSLLSKANDVSRPGVRDVLPVASLVLLVGGLVFAGAPGSLRINRALLAAQHLSVVGFGLLVLTIGAMSIFLQPVISGITALLQDKVHWRLIRLISYRVSRRKRNRRDMTQHMIDHLYQLASERADRRSTQSGTIELTTQEQEQIAGRADTLSASELDEIEELSDRLRRYPAHGRVRATTLGNILAAAEEDAGRPYGLDSRVALPRLEPLLPESAAKELNAKRDDLTFATRFCATLVLAMLASTLLLITDGIWLLLPVSVAVFAILSYMNAVTAAVAYGEMLRVIFDLHRFLLYKAFYLPLPANSEEDRAIGYKLTEFFETGVSSGFNYMFEEPSGMTASLPATCRCRRGTRIDNAARRVGHADQGTHLRLLAVYSPNQVTDEIGTNGLAALTDTSCLSARHAEIWLPTEVRRARFGPGLWPGPRHQARWAGRGLRGQRRAGGASRIAGCEAPLRPEGPARTMRGVLARRLLTSPRRSAQSARGDGLVVVLAGAAAGYGGDRKRPVTGGAMRGSRRAVGLASEGRGESCRPQRRDPRVNPDRLRRVTLAVLPSRLLTLVLAVHGHGRQAWRAGGAPLKP